MIDLTSEKLCSERLSWMRLGLILMLYGIFFNFFSRYVWAGVIYCVGARVLGSYAGEDWKFLSYSNFSD
jgi:hypothetical protein